MNVNSGVRVADNIIEKEGKIQVNKGGEISRTEVNDGGVLSVAAGGLAEDTTVNSGGSLQAAMQAKLNNLLAKGGAILDIDNGAVLTGDIIIEADAKLGGSYDYGNIFKDEVTESGSLTLVGGLNDALVESSLVNNVADKKLNLSGGYYELGLNAQAVIGWDQLFIKDSAEVKIDGDIALSGANKKLYIENGSRLNLAGNSPTDYQIVGSVINDGTLDFNHDGDDADDITTIYGNYKAYNNAQMNIDVNPSNNTADLLRIEGDVEGTTGVVLKLVGLDVRPSEMIKFVEAPNDDLGTGAYFNILRMDGSAYTWNSLYSNGAWYTATDDIIANGSQSGYGNGNLGSMEAKEDFDNPEVDLPDSFPEVPEIVFTPSNSGRPSVVGEAISYMGLPSAGIEQTRDMLRGIGAQVAASKYYNGVCGGYYDCAYDGKAEPRAWAGTVYSYSDVEAPYAYEAEISGFEGGFDIQSDVYNRLGVFASYRQGKYDFDGRGEDYYSRVGSETEIDSYIMGLYHRYDKGRINVMSGIYAGMQEVEISSDDGIGAKTDGIEYGGSIEAGYVFMPQKGLTVEPMVRLAYTEIDYDKIKDDYGKEAKYEDVRNLETEVGVKVEKKFELPEGYAKIYVKPSVIQNFGSGDVEVTSLQEVEGLEDATMGRFELGGSMELSEKWSGYVSTSYTFGSDYENASITAGLTYAF